MQNVIAFIGDPAVRKAVTAMLSNRKSLDFVVAIDETEVLARIDAASLVVTDLPDSVADDFLQAVIGVHAPKFSTPIVILTSKANERQAVQALRDGATSYVPIRLIDTELNQTIDSVFAVANAHQGRSRIMQCVTRWHNEFVLENDASLIGPLVRYFQESTQRMGLLCEPNEETRLGMALEEALLNSMYHGNLEVSSKLREDDDSVFYAMIRQRQQEKPYCDRRVRVRSDFCREAARFVISDEGPGFDVESVPDPRKLENVARVCGRGMLLIRTFMDEVKYNSAGNEVTLTKRRGACQQATESTQPE